MIDLSTATATDALDALARGAITSEALLTAQLERVERFNPVLNAVVAMDLDGALRDARAADEARRQGRLTGPLHGLPMTIKDIFATRGLVTTSGHAPLSDYRPEADAPAVAALRAAGAVVFGKTNLPEFGGDIQSYNDIFGLCRNPWNPERTAGGSSGGSGAALASGMTLLELGSDIGGSIRVPCHYNGVFGHKPTWNAVDRFGESPRPPVWAHALMDLVVAGPMGRSVADVRLGLDVLTAITTGGIPGARHRRPRRPVGRGPAHGTPGDRTPLGRPDDPGRRRPHRNPERRFPSAPRLLRLRTPGRPRPELCAGRQAGCCCRHGLWGSRQCRPGSRH